MNQELTSENKAQAWAAENSPGCVVEIGVLNGNTAKWLCEHNPKLTVYGIDPIIPDSMNQSLVGNIDRIKENTKGLNHVFINDYSFNVVKTWHTPIGYLFIDGDHTYEAVKRDYDEWFPFVMPGGFIGIHDSTSNRGGPANWPGPSRLADELIKEERMVLVCSIQQITLFKKA